MKSKTLISGVGSLPHPNIDSALKHVFKYDIPYLPQLPRISPEESMIFQALDGLGTLSIQQGSVSLKDILPENKWMVVPQYSAYHAFNPFLFDIKKDNYNEVKIELAGPFTCSYYLNSNLSLQERFPLIQKFIIQKICTMANYFSDYKLHIQIDEPALFLLGRDDYPTYFHSTINQLHHLHSALIGVHCCSNANWSKILEVPLDFLSFDFWEVHQSISAKLLQDLTYLYIGILPTTNHPQIPLTEMANKLKAWLPPKHPSLVLTPTCGLALKSIKESELYLRDLRRLQMLMSNSTH